MTTTRQDPPPLGAAPVRELIADLARTEDDLRSSRFRGFTERDVRTVRRQAALVRELRRRTPLRRSLAPATLRG